MTTQLTGWAITANPAGLGLLPVKHGSPGVPMPGYAIDILSDEGEILPAGTLGNVAIRLPLPPSCLPTLWNADARMRSAYLERFLLADLRRVRVAEMATSTAT